MQKETKDTVIAMGSSFLAGVVVTILIFALATFMVKPCPRGGKMMKRDFHKGRIEMQGAPQHHKFFKGFHKMGDHKKFGKPFKIKHEQAPIPVAEPTQEDVK